MLTLDFSYGFFQLFVIYIFSQAGSAIIFNPKISERSLELPEFMVPNFEYGSIILNYITELEIMIEY